MIIGESIFESPISMSLSRDTSCSSEAVSRTEISPQLQALGELEFRKAFLILSYMGRCVYMPFRFLQFAAFEFYTVFYFVPFDNSYKLEEVISADKIRAMGHLPMDKFEAEVWKAVGNRCGYIKENERVKVLFLHNIDWFFPIVFVIYCLAL